MNGNSAQDLILTMYVMFQYVPIPNVQKFDEVMREFVLVVVMGPSLPKYDASLVQLGPVPLFIIDAAQHHQSFPRIMMANTRLPVDDKNNLFVVRESTAMPMIGAERS